MRRDATGLSVIAQRHGPQIEPHLVWRRERRSEFVINFGRGGLGRPEPLSYGSIPSSSIAIGQNAGTLSSDKFVIFTDGFFLHELIIFVLIRP